MKFLTDATYSVLPDVATYALYLRMKLSGAFDGSGLEAPGVTVAGVEDDFGVLMDTDPYQSGNRQTIRLANAQGSVPMVAAGVIAYGAIVYPAASGKITATVQGNPIGLTMEPASGNGSVIEVYRFNRAAPVQFKSELIATSVDKVIGIASGPFVATSIKWIPAVAGTDGGAVSLDVRKILAASTALPGDAAGVNVIELLSAPIDLKSAAGTTVAGALSAVAGALTFATGDKVGINFTGVLTSLSGAIQIDGYSL